MTHKLERLEKNRIFNKPHLIASEAFESVMEYFKSRPDGLMSKEELSIAKAMREQKKRTSIVGNQVAVIPVSGVLTYEETFMGALCGMSSYQGIESLMRQAINEGAKVVVLDVDSGGGEAYGTFETAKELRKLANENDIKLLAYVDGISASAAYGLTVAADEIIANPYAEVGSIGVLMKLQNDSEKRKKDGIETKYVYAGGDKIPFDEDGGWRQSFLDDLQVKVDKLYGDFTNHVSEMRGIDEEVVSNTEAKMFITEDAKELGLIDSVMERSEFFDYLADIVEGKEMPILGNNLFKNKKEEEMSKEKEDVVAQENPVETALTNEDTTAKLAELEALVAELTADKQAAKLAEEEAKAALKASQMEELEAKLANFSFVTDAKELAVITDKLEESESKLLFDVFTKAEQAIEENVTEELAIEGEAEPELEGADKAKQATAEKIKAKYAVSE